jgi:hypothetical protein
MPALFHKAANRSEFCIRGLEETHDVGLDRYIRLHCQGLDAVSLAAVHNLGSCGAFGTIADAHVPPVAGHEPRRRRADTPTPASHDHNATHETSVPSRRSGD